MENALNNISDLSNKVKELEQKILFMKETTLDLVWEINSDNKITFINQQWLLLLNLKSDDLLGKDLTTIIKITTIDRSEKFKNHIKKRKAITHLEHIIISAENKKLFFETFAYPYFNNDGLFEGYIGRSIHISKRINEQKKLEKIAYKDSLTKIYNRHRFNELAIIELRSANRYMAPLSLILFDLDHFKKVNDTYGHDIGDLVLLNVAKEVSKKLRGTDHFARWGGEEFIILLPNTDKHHAFEVAEKIRNHLENLSIKKCPKFTASLGVTQYKTGELFIETLRRADKSLYGAKESGRNRTGPLE